MGGVCANVLTFNYGSS